MSRNMEATFVVPGWGNYHGGDTLTIEPIDTNVTLWTNGQFVQIKPGSVFDTVLTPDGWEELARHAHDLVNEANRAWGEMGAES